MSLPSFSAVAESLLAAGVSIRFRAGGRSMRPALRDGDHLTVAPIAARDVRVGDVVLCTMPRGPVAHRVRAIDAAVEGVARFVLRGDAAMAPDRPAAGPQIWGRVVRAERDGRAFPVGGVLRRRVALVKVRLREAIAEARAFAVARPATR
ncbi:MAG TPA: S24/S26 family peptidase [Polyangia bacterium]|nr:S24/S26 family peptidase [Polyangia bacterium]